MNVKLEKKEKNTVHFTFELDSDEFKNAVQEAYLQNRNQFNIPGFRKGRVPRQIIELNFGKDIFYEEAVNIMLPEAYMKAVEELDIDPVDQPIINIEDEIKLGKNIEISAKVDVVPEVKLGNYDEIEIEKVDFSVTDEMIDIELERVQNQNARLVDAGEEAAKEGNIVNIDFTGYIDEEPFEGGSAKAYDLELGQGQFIPGFEEQLVGHKKGDEVEVKVTFPEDYHEEDFAEKEALFRVKINNVRIKELPELDDDFAIDISEFDTLEEYKTDLRTNLELQMADQEEETIKNKAIEYVVENSEMDIPRGMIDSEIDEELGQMDFNLRQQGLELEQYLDIMNQDILGIREQIEPMAIQRIKANLVLEEIAKKEGIEVSDEDVEKELRNLGEQQGAEDLDEFVEQMKLGDLTRFKSGISNSKVIDLLVDNVKMVEVEETEGK